MSIEGTLWNKRSSSWRELMDSATITWDFSTNHEAKANLVDVGGAIPDASLTYSKIQNVSASPRLLGRATAGAGVIEEITLDQAFNFIATATQGNLLYRATASWSLLAPGTSGQLLQTQGAGANLQWTTPATPGLVLLTSGSVNNSATLDIVLTSYTSYRGIQLVLMNFVPATDDADLWLRVSTDGGANYDSGASDYSRTLGFTHSNATSIGYSNDGTAASVVIAGAVTGGYGVSNVAAEGGANVTLDVLDQTNTAVRPKINIPVSNWMNSTGYFSVAFASGMRVTAQDTDAIRILFSSGNIASGKYALYGYN